MIAISRVTLAAVVVCSMASFAFGDVSADFETPDYSGSAAGTLLTGQQGWYLPVYDPVSDEYYVYTYADNPFGMTAENPTGGLQFAAGRVEDFTNHGRGQHDEALTPGLPVLYGYDFNVKSTLADPSLTPFSNAGSFSLQPSGENYIALMHRQGGDPPVNDPGVNYTYSYNQMKDANGDDLGQQHISATLLEDHWYRDEAIVDFESNRVIQVTLTDLETMAQTIIEPEDWYLPGGDTRPVGMATGFRMFNFWAANNTNMMAFDNVTVQSIPEPSTFCLLGAGALFVILAWRRRRAV